MNLTLIAYLAAAASLFGSGFGAAWQWQSANITKLELSHANERIAIQRQARATLERNISAVSTAQAKAQSRMVRLAADNRNATSALDSLRSTSASALRSAANDIQACTRSLASHSVVLGQCSGRLVEVARDADQLVSEVILYQDAWPRNR